jgi:hypothetical protein
LNTFKELIESQIKRNLVSIAPNSPGEQNFVDQQTVNKSFSDRFLVPNNGLFNGAGNLKGVKVFNRSKNHFGRDEDQSIEAYDKGDNKSQEPDLKKEKEAHESVLEFFNNGKLRKVGHRDTKRLRHIIIDGKVIAVSSADKNNKEAIKNYLARSTDDKLHSSKLKVESVNEADDFKVGRKVHAGLATKGGAGFVGHITKVGENHVHINIGKNKFGDRVVKAHKSVCTCEQVESEESQLLEAIGNPNNSGQGHDPEHKNHPLHKTLQKHGYEYSHSTPIKRELYVSVADEGRKPTEFTSHAYCHPETGHRVGCDSDTYCWHSHGKGGHMKHGDGAITLARHLKARQAKLNDPVIDGEKVNAASVDNAIHAGIHDDGIHADHDNAIMAGIRVPKEPSNAIHASIHDHDRTGYDDVVGENVNETKKFTPLSHITKAGREINYGELYNKNPNYSKTAVDKEIKKDKRIKGKEAKAIHALLKGRQKTDESVESVNELSKGVLASYAKKAMKDYGDHNYDAGYDQGDYHEQNRKIPNREKGVSRAVDKLAKPDKKKVTDDGWKGYANESQWIAGAIKHPGALTRKAKAAGESNSEFEQDHKHDSGKTGDEARLALTLKKMHKEDVTNEGLFGNPKQKHAFKKVEKKDEKKPEEKKDEKPVVNEIALSALKLFADSKNKMTNDKSKIDDKNDKVDRVKELVKKMREKK